MIITILLIILGLGILIAGAEGLVRGASSLAKRIGISSLVIGLTVVAFGTSMPELTVNIFAALRGAPDIAIGNIVGSNIANILLILGIAALIYPLTVKKSTAYKEIPLALLAIVILFVMGNDILFDQNSANALTRTDGLTLIGIFGIFLFYVINMAKKEKVTGQIKTYPWPLAVALTIGGLILLVIGGKVLVDNAIILAQLAGMSEALIGLTIMAVGTSLPELATSVVAVMHHQDDIAVGNIVGSNIFNVLWILGLTGTISYLPLSAQANIDLLVCIGVTLLLLIFVLVKPGLKLQRWHGFTFLLLYICYIVYLIYRG